MVKTAIVAGVALGLAGASEAFMPSPAMHGVVGAREARPCLDQGDAGGVKTEQLIFSSNIVCALQIYI